MTININYKTLALR